MSMEYRLGTLSSVCVRAGVGANAGALKGTQGETCTRYSAVPDAHVVEFSGNDV